MCLWVLPLHIHMDLPCLHRCSWCFMLKLSRWQAQLWLGYQHSAGAWALNQGSQTIQNSNSEALAIAPSKLKALHPCRLVIDVASKLTQYAVCVSAINCCCAVCAVFNNQLWWFSSEHQRGPPGRWARSQGMGGSTHAMQVTFCSHTKCQSCLWCATFMMYRKLIRQHLHAWQCQLTVLFKLLVMCNNHIVMQVIGV